MLNTLLRIGQWANKHHIKFIPGLINKSIRFFYSCDIPSNNNWPKSIKFAHKGLGCCINSSVIFGENVFIYQNVTIGKRKASGGVPKIGNNVCIGAGAIILGDIEIGDNARIGAGAIVVKNVPTNATCIGYKAGIVEKEK